MAGSGRGIINRAEARFQCVKNFCEANAKEFTQRDLQTGELLYKRSPNPKP